MSRSFRFLSTRRRAAPAHAKNRVATRLDAAPSWFEAARSGGGHRRYSRDDLERANRARQLVDDGIRLDAAARIVSLEYQLATAHAMIETLRRKPAPPGAGTAAGRNRTPEKRSR